MGKSKRNILDKENGFNIRVNLYIIRYLYSHMDKANAFLLEKERDIRNEKKSKRRKYKDFCDPEVSGISRPRLQRIFRGFNFEITDEEKKTFIKDFNIDEDYFQENGKLIEIHNVTSDDWKCFFKIKYEDSLGVPKMHLAKMEKGSNNVENGLKELALKDHVISKYDTGTAVYRIFYYFKNKDSYKEATRLNKFLTSLKCLEISDWSELKGKPDEMKEYRSLLAKHYEYLHVYLRCKELEAN